MKSLENACHRPIPERLMCVHDEALYKSTFTFTFTFTFVWRVRPILLKATRPGEFSVPRCI